MLPSLADPCFPCRPLSPVPCPLSPIPCPLLFLPITPAHVAAAWPLHAVARRLPLAALVIGTVAPDLEYVFRLRPEGKFGHSPLGLLVFCVPVTLLVFWTWRALIIPVLRPLLPPGLQPGADGARPTRRPVLVGAASVAALLGAGSHVLWDGFTHPSGWSASIIPGMAEVSPFWDLTWYALAQYASSLAGVLVILLWIVVALHRIPAAARRFAPGQGRRLGLALLVVAVGALAAAALNTLPARGGEEVAGRAAVGAEVGFALGLAGYALFARSRGLARGVPPAR
jgi:hypothetical protein